MIDFEDELVDKKKNGVSNSELRKELLEKNILYKMQMKFSEMQIIVF